MPWQGSRDHEHLAVIELVPAPIFRRPLQIGVADSRLHDLHTRHVTPLIARSKPDALKDLEDI